MLGFRFSKIISYAFCSTSHQQLLVPRKPLWWRGGNGIGRGPCGGVRFVIFSGKINFLSKIQDSKIALGCVGIIRFFGRVEGDEHLNPGYLLGLNQTLNSLHFSFPPSQHINFIFSTPPLSNRGQGRAVHLWSEVSIGMAEKSECLYQKSAIIDRSQPALSVSLQPAPSSRDPLFFRRLQHLRGTHISIYLHTPSLTSPPDYQQQLSVSHVRSRDSNCYYPDLSARCLLRRGAQCTTRKYVSDYYNEAVTTDLCGETQSSPVPSPIIP